MFALLRQAFASLHRQLGDTKMARRIAVGAARYHLALDGSPHLRDFFGPLIDEQHDHVHFRMVQRDGLSDMLQENRFAGSRGRHNQTSLALPDGRQQIHDSRGQRLRGSLQDNLLVGVDRRELVEISPGILGRHIAFDVLDASEPGRASLSACLGRPRHKQTFAQSKMLNQGDRNIRVGGLGHKVTRGIPKESEALGVNFEHALYGAEIANHNFGTR